jgi:hypothetical protein
MSLSEKEKQKINDEESKRLEEEEYRDRVKKNLNKGPWWKPKGILAWIVVIVILWIVIANVIGNFVRKNASQNTPSSVPTISQADKSAIAQTFCSARSKPNARYVNLDDFIAMYNANGKTVTLKPVINITPSADKCAQVIDICLKLWNKDDCGKIAERNIWIGMDKEELILAWGLPNHKNDTVGAWGINSQWVYGDFKPYVYLEGKSDNDLKVTSWQD